MTVSFVVGTVRNYFVNNSVRLVLKTSFVKSLIERDNGGSAFVVLETFTLELGVGLNLMSLVLLVGVDGVSFVSLVNEFISHRFPNSFAIFYKQLISMTI